MQKLLPEQGLLEDQERWLAVLRFFDEVEDFGARLDARWAAQPADQGPGVSATRWQELEAEVAKVAKVHSLGPVHQISLWQGCIGQIGCRHKNTLAAGRRARTPRRPRRCSAS